MDVAKLYTNPQSTESQGDVILTHTKHHIVQDHKQKSGTFNGASEKLENFLKRHGKTSEGIFGLNKTLRYHEAMLEPNEAIAVYGKGIWKKAEDLGLDPKYGRVLHITNPEKGKIYFNSADVDLHVSD